MSLLSIFKSGIFKNSKTISAPVAPSIEVSPVKGRSGEAERGLVQTPSVDTAAIVAQAQAQAQNQAREIILAAKDEAFKLKDQAIKDARLQLEEIEVRT